ncbi:multidrug efflux pump subunit AcrA (membrane-fusion protein) [Desulfitispora alkaliphila]|uniref:efflux RND transporter periplasmic adaptor subunit n=1 Tax=Desulfitispora alkaliphila TaxID=622674 RepID=UPI003D22AA88
MPVKNAIMLMITILLILTGGCSSGEGQLPENQGKPVTIETAQEEVLTQEKRYGVQLEPGREIEVTFQVAGKIDQVHVREGELVESGQLLINLDQRDQGLRLERAMAGLEQAQNRLKQLQELEPSQKINLSQAQARVETLTITVDELQAEYERTVQLAQEGAVAPVELEMVENRLNSTQKELIKAKEQVELIKMGPGESQIENQRIAVRSAQIDVKEAQLNLERHQLTAPAAGVVMEKAARPGQQVSQGQQALVIAGGESISAEVEVPLEHLDLWEQRTGAFITRGDQEVEARVVHISRNHTGGRNSVQVSLEVDSQPKWLLGEYAEAIVRGGEVKGIFIPVEAVLRDSQGPYVYADEEGLAVRKRVELGLPLGNNIQVMGLGQGTEVVVAGMERLQPGDLLYRVGE